MSDPINSNLPDKINCGETTIKDTPRIVAIFICLLVGGLLIGLGIGWLLGLFAG
jgi:hypothetical protein